jgi:hypothetical protein
MDDKDKIKLDLAMRSVFDDPYPGYDGLMVKTSDALMTAFSDEKYSKEMAKIWEAQKEVHKLLQPTFELQKKIDELMRPSREIQERLENAMRPSLNIQEALSSMMSPHLELQRKAIDAFKTLNLPIIKPLTDYGDQYRKIIEAREKKYPNLSSNLEKIAKHSWFFCSDMSFRSYERLAFIVEGVDDETEQKEILDREFSIVYGESFDYLGAQIAKQFPLRDFAITPALDAHREGKFALSVPVFFSQAEGIVREITSAEMFSKTNRMFTNIADYATKQRSLLGEKTSWIDIIDDSVWAQLSIELPLAVSGNKYKSGINRNLILHGIDLAYATEIYSLKAFSLLCHAAGLGEN